jgi:hypothetical protein
MAITTRAAKGSALTHNELDTNFTDLVAADAVTDAALVATDVIVTSNVARLVALEDPLTIYTMGFEDYNDSTTAGTPIAMTSANTAYPLTNDGAGAFTNKTYQLPGYNDIWNTSTNLFDFDGAGLVLGDTVDFRIDLDIINSGANGAFVLHMELAIGSGSPYTLEIDEHLYKGAGTHKEVVMFSIYMGDTNTLNNGARFTLESDSTGDSVIVNGWYVRVIPRHAVHA